MFFTKADPRNARAVSYILDIFAKMYSLKINAQKSKVFLGRCSRRAPVASFLHMEIAELPATYLGLLLFSGKLTKNICQPLINKIQRRLDVWKCKLLSLASRVELTISTLSNFHLFWPFAFPLPASVIKAVDKICRDFIWGDSSSKKKMHTINWSVICLPRDEGGLGVKNVKEISIAGMVLNLWNLASEKVGLWIRWIDGKYLIKDSIWTYSSKQSDSWLWKKFLAHRDVIREHFLFKVGIGSRFRL